MTETIKQAIDFYLANEMEPAFIDEVKRLMAKKDEAALSDAFYRTLEFGTAGLRGVIGGGTNRMNTLVVKRAAQGMANYVIQAFPEEAKRGELRVAVAYDCRHYSKEFALATALIFVANGFTCYLFSDLRPTPELSYTIRQLHCHTGVVVTASHNPKQYNGYKAYWGDGAQITPPHDAGIIEKVNSVTTVKELSKEEALATGRLKIIDKEIDEKFWRLVKSKVTRTQLIAAEAKNVEIVYTPLHGTGALHVEKVMSDLGFKLITVPEQRNPDGNFPTASYPNPEERAAMQMGMELATKKNANILMATDPDADRFACAVKNKNGNMEIITGNQMGALFTDYIALTAREQNRLPKNAVMIRSIVTSRLVDKIAAGYGVKMKECLTGFKWICGLVDDIVREGREQYLFGFEESYGYNFGEEIRDKDGITACALCAEMYLYWHSKGKSLLDRLDELFNQYGVFMEKTTSAVFEGESGAKKMAEMMEHLRTTQLSDIAGIPVELVRDIERSVQYSPQTPHKTAAVDLPKSDVLQYYLKGGSVICVRPSGTEPKIKTYILYQEPVETGVEQTKLHAGKMIEKLEAEISKLLTA